MEDIDAQRRVQTCDFFLESSQTRIHCGLSVILQTPEAYGSLGLVGDLNDVNYADKRVGRVQEVSGKYPPATCSMQVDRLKDTCSFLEGNLPLFVSED